MILPQRQTVMVAKQAAEVAVLSGNRLRLGVGTWWNEVEYVGLNETFTNRGRRQAEQVELLRRLWTEPSFEFRGEFQTLHAGVHEQGKKVLEEAGEVWLAAEHEADDALAEEISQLLYRIQVLMIGRKITLEDVYKYL